MSKRLSPDRLAAATVAAAMDFYERRPWERVRNEHPFAVRLPDEPTPLIGIVMGAEGTFGLQLFRGEKALEHFLAIIDQARASRELIDPMSMVSFAVGRRRELEPAGRRYLDQAKFHGRLVPHFLLKPPGEQARANPRREEAELLLRAMKGIEVAQTRGLFAPRSCASVDDEVLTLDVSGEILAPTVQVTFGRVPTHEAAPIEPIPLPRDLQSLPKSSGRWFVGAPVVDMLVEGDDRTMRGAIVYDVGADRLLAMRPVHGHDLDELSSVLFEAFRGRAEGSLDAGLPREIQFASETMYLALADGLEALGIRCEHSEWLPALDEIVRNLERFLRGEADGPEPTVIDVVDEPCDVAGWKTVESAAVQLVGQLLTEKGLASRKAVMTFFGHAAALEDFDHNPLALLAFQEWLTTDYRTKKGRRTTLERLVDGPLPGPIRRVLVARMEATPSVWIVDRVSSEAGTIALRDMVSDETAAVHDGLLSQTARPDIGLPGRVIGVGEFRFLVLLGPPLAPMLLDPACSFLEDQGVPLTRSGLAAQPHMLGRLWEWCEERLEDAPPHLTNTDGDDLVHISASFRVNEPSALAAALAERDDVERDDEDGTWTWVRSDDDRTQLARLRPVDDRLIVELNSRERLARARRWLEPCGAAFESATETEIDLDAAAPTEDSADDDRSEPSPEITARLQSMLTKQCMAWLDERVPALGDKTPREACRTEVGRRRVARMIRSWPRPGGAGEVHIPREEMLKQLGIDQDEAWA